MSSTFRTWMNNWLVSKKSKTPKNNFCYTNRLKRLKPGVNYTMNSTAYIISKMADTSFTMAAMCMESTTLCPQRQLA